MTRSPGGTAVRLTEPHAGWVHAWMKPHRTVRSCRLSASEKIERIRAKCALADKAPELFLGPCPIRSVYFASLFFSPVCTFKRRRTELRESPLLKPVGQLKPCPAIGRSPRTRRETKDKSWRQSLALDWLGLRRGRSLSEPSKLVRPRVRVSARVGINASLALLFVTLAYQEKHVGRCATAFEINNALRKLYSLRGADNMVE